MIRINQLKLQIPHTEEALEKFDIKTISEGTEMLKKYTFPTPVIR